MFHDVGVKVTLLEYLPRIVPLEDGEVSKALERSFTKRGITVMTNARFDAGSRSRPTRTASALMVGPEGKEPAELRAEMMLVATGRAANIEDIGLETTKVETDRGVIKVERPHADEGAARLRHRRRRSAACGSPTPRRTRASSPRTRSPARPTSTRWTTRPQPHATYCRPEIASIGLTEEQVKAAGTPYKIGKVPFQAIAKAIIGGEYEGFAKVIADTTTDDTLGVHIIGPHATDLIAEASLGFTLEAAAWEIGAATHAHPTLSEIVGEAAMAVDGRSINF